MIESLCLCHIQAAAPLIKFTMTKLFCFEQLLLLNEKGEKFTQVKMLENCANILLFFHKRYIEEKYIMEIVSEFEVTSLHHGTDKS